MRWDLTVTAIHILHLTAVLQHCRFCFNKFLRVTLLYSSTQIVITVAL